MINKSMRVEEPIHMVPHAFLLQNANPNGPVNYIFRSGVLSRAEMHNTKND